MIIPNASGKTDIYKKNNSSQYVISCDKPQK